jgi:predicted metalloprotease with PDZ domain
MLDHDGSSPVIHELVHVAMSADSEAGADALVEGLAEYYAVMLLRRAGLTSDSELERSLAALRERGEGAERLHTHSADAAERARTVVLLADLDAWLRGRPEAKRGSGLDAVVRVLAADPADVTPERFVEAVRRATGVDSRGFLAERAPSLFEAEAADAAPPEDIAQEGANQGTKKHEADPGATPD